MRWSLHYCLPGDAVPNIFNGESLDAVLAEAEHKLRIGARLVGIFDATDLYLSGAQIEERLARRKPSRPVKIVKPKKKTKKKVKRAT